MKSSTTTGAITRTPSTRRVRSKPPPKSDWQLAVEAEGGRFLPKGATVPAGTSPTDPPAVASQGKAGRAGSVASTHFPMQDPALAPKDMLVAQPGDEDTEVDPLIRRFEFEIEVGHRRLRSVLYRSDDRGVTHMYVGLQHPVVDEEKLEEMFVQHPLLVYSALQEFASVPTRRYDALPSHPDPLPVDVQRKYILVGEGNQ